MFHIRENVCIQTGSDLSLFGGIPEPAPLDESLKINIVPDDFDEETPALAPEINLPDESTRTPPEVHRRRPLQVVKAEGIYLWRLMKRCLFHREAQGCLIGLGVSTLIDFRFSLMLGFQVNTAAIGTVAYLAYVKWDLPRWNRRVVASVSVGLVALLGVER